MNERERREGFKAGKANETYNLRCPYDRRMREGRAWVEGYAEGEAARRAKDRRKAAQGN